MKGVRGGGGEEPFLRKKGGRGICPFPFGLRKGERVPGWLPPSLRSGEEEVPGKKKRGGRGGDRDRKRVKGKARKDNSIDKRRRRKFFCWMDREGSGGGK